MRAPLPAGPAPRAPRRTWSRGGGWRVAPALELDDVALGVRRITPRDAAAVGGLRGDDVADAPAAGGHDLVERRRDIRHLERDVAPAGPRDRGPGVGRCVVVLEDLQRRPRRSETRQPQV